MTRIKSTCDLYFLRNIRGLFYEISHFREVANPGRLCYTVLELKKCHENLRLTSQGYYFIIRKCVIELSLYHAKAQAKL